MTKSKFQLVGSLLRPADLRKYKDEIEHRDDIQYPFYDALPGYQETETADIKQIVADQKANGIDILTDGEFGRSMWHLDFVWGFKGIERYIAEHGYTFKDHDGGQYETRKDIGIRITEPLSGKNHHYLDIYKLVKAEAGDEDTKQTIWGPAHAYTNLLSLTVWLVLDKSTKQMKTSKKVSLMPIKNSWKNTRLSVEKLFNLMTVSGNFLTHQTLQVSLRKVILIWQNWLMSL